MTSTIPLTQIESVLSSASQYLYILTSQLATATGDHATRSLSRVAMEVEVSISYYSFLELSATATNPAVKSQAAIAAASASAINDAVQKANSFYGGVPPNLKANIAFVILFVIFAVLFFVFVLFSRQWWFSITWLIGFILEVVGYAARAVSHKNVKNFKPFVAQLVCITLGASFMLAGNYYTLAQMAMVFAPEMSIFRPGLYSWIFIILDLIAIILQAVGGALASIALKNGESVMNGDHIMIVGLAFQVFSLLLFQCCWYLFFYRVYKAYKTNGNAALNPDYQFIRDRKMFRCFVPAISLATLFIFVRSCYRLAELSNGFNSSIALNETLFYILETMMILLAALTMTIFNPLFAYGKRVKIVVPSIFKKKQTLAPATLQDKEQDDY